jgi:hypothetical protein
MDMLGWFAMLAADRRFDSPEDQIDPAEPQVLLIREAGPRIDQKT